MHTYKLINRAGKETYVKFHWKTKQGACCVLCSEVALPTNSALTFKCCAA